MDTNQNFFLLKNEDGSVFGPVALAELKSWAEQALISPFDKISTDQQAWNRAPMLADLGMDFLIQVSDEDLYGPTTLGAIKEFYKLGEINQQTPVINCIDGSVASVASLPLPADDESEEEETSTPRATSLRTALQQRVKELEATVAEQRRYIARLEEAYTALETQLEAKG